MSQEIEAREVPESERHDALSRYFGDNTLLVEGAIYYWIRALVSKYRAGRWRFFELSNGGFFMAPDCPKELEVVVSSNGFEDTLTPETAGVIVCLLALRTLALALEDNRLIERHHQLYDFAVHGPDADAIICAID